MGLFDDIRVEYPIPGIEPFDDQTKELECYQYRYKIDAGGRLLMEKWEYVDKTPEEKAAEEAEALFLPVLSKKRVNPRWEPEPYTGSLTLEPEGSTVVLWLVDGVVKDCVVKPDVPVAPPQSA